MPKGNSSPRLLPLRHWGCWLLVVALIAPAVVSVSCSPLRRASVVDAAEEGDLGKLKVLLSQGRSINERSATKFGWTPLIAAIYQNNSNVVDFLIKAGADVNAGDTNGVTPLMWAIGRGDEGLDLVKTLVANGADINATDRRGAAVLSYASSNPAKPKILIFLKEALLEQEKKTSIK